MQFRFKIQPFQTAAVESVVRVFEGQPRQEASRYRRDVGVKAQPKAEIEGQVAAYQEPEDEIGFHNSKVLLNDAELLRNIQKIQDEGNLMRSTVLAKELGAVSLDVEMETGTGKTYVYIKTMFELYERYGWGKFIVVVPSVAIREGVRKSFEMTRQHFFEQYGYQARFFIYDSGNLHLLDEFSQNSGINVMIVNAQAFASSMNEEKNIEGRKGDSAARIIYSKRDEFASRRPIDVIKANRPIIILDEPQKLQGEATQKALKKHFNALFSLNYSATHKNRHNLVYVLDALDAFRQKLVKKIEVKGFEVKNLGGTDGYLYLSEILLDRRKPPRAKLELEVNFNTGIKRKTLQMEQGDDLFAASKGLEQYKNLFIADIDPLRGHVILSNSETLPVGAAAGNVNEAYERRIQIRETILSHFEKEAKLYSSGIKCLSLFFIDKVAGYRQYNAEGESVLGEYGRVFEEEYTAALEERLTLFNTPYEQHLRRIDVCSTHQGYFSVDKKGRAVDKGENTAEAISAYDLIMKQKERLLSLEEPTRFIFSHSALREGWDNPNVFQICTLKHSNDAVTKRQEVGRGLRLCVDRHGDRQDLETLDEQVHGVNVLTVIASESYANFVEALQSEIDKELYKRPTKASADYFKGKR